MIAAARCRFGAEPARCGTRNGPASTAGERGLASNDSGPEEGALVWRALSPYVRYVYPGARSVRTRAASSGGLHRGIDEREPDLPRGAVGASAPSREHRNL